MSNGKINQWRRCVRKKSSKSPDEKVANSRTYQQKYGSPAKRIYTNGGGLWECIECKSTLDDNIRLDMHHKDQNHSNNEFENLECMCFDCHNKLHKKWVNETITKLIQDGIVDWKGNIIT